MILTEKTRGFAGWPIETRECGCKVTEKGYEPCQLHFDYICNVALKDFEQEYDGKFE